LIEAFRLLRDRHREESWDLVFTGEKPGYLPPELRKLVEECELQGRVKVLGRVDRRMLATLFRRAFATVVPSLYEQGSFQIYEALQADCPVVCSRIPPFLEQCGPMGEGMVYFDPHDPEDIARTILAIRDDREGIRARQRRTSRVLWNRTWNDVARDFLQICKEVTPRPVPEAFLFLPIPIQGGIWETTKDLLRALVEINRERRQLALTVGILSEQKDTAALEQMVPEISIERFQLGDISRQEGEWHFRSIFKEFPESPTSRFTMMKGCEPVALRADAWLALSDRFPTPLLPLRPYGVVVYDMIQRHLPKAFAPEFFQRMKEGMTPTLGGAETVLVTSPATRDDVIAEYQLNPDQIELIPIACEPHRRFCSITGQRVNLPREPFILNVGNAGEHKGGDILLRAITRMKQKAHGQVPLLVYVGVRTDAMSPQYRGAIDYPWWSQIRQLVLSLGLVEGHDVTFLGFVSDEQLLDLYQRCAVVVNAARYDNGSYSLIEGAYFGRPLVSSRYPGVEFLCDRFQVPVHYFPVDDDGALVSALERALEQKPIQGRDLDWTRQRLLSPELSYRVYAERVYNLLIRLARKGRENRLSTSSWPDTRSIAA
jgi:glycosyltransferase involved in cell wall biosynthesis